MRHLRRLVAGLTAAGLGLGLLAATSPAADAVVSAPRPIATGWLPYWASSADLQTILDNQDLFGDVSPFWFMASGNSPSISITTHGTNFSKASATSSLRAQGIKVLPTITDGSGATDMSRQLSTTSGRARMVSLITDLVVSNGYDGIDLDWEGWAFNSSDRAIWDTTRVRWVAFIKSLSASLHARGKLLAVTAPAGVSTSSDSTGYWVYAWSLIGPYVDKLRIMAYDYSVTADGPIAPYTWVQKVVAQAVTQVGSRKIQIGFPAYGRDWRVRTVGTCHAVPSSAAARDAFEDALYWAKASRHEFEARAASTYVANNLGGIAGVTMVQAPVATWNDVAKEKTSTYQTRFVHAESTALTTAAGFTGGTNAWVESSSGVSVGDLVTGTGIGAGAKVSTVTAHQLVFSVANSANVRGSLTVRNVQTSAATGAAGETTVRLSAVKPIQVGAIVNGTGLDSSAWPTVVSVATDSSGATPVSVVTLNKANTGAVSGTLTFTRTRSVLSTAGWTGGGVVRFPSTAALPDPASVVIRVSGAGIPGGAAVDSITANGVYLMPGQTLTGPVSGSLTFTWNSSCTITRTAWWGESGSAQAVARLVAQYKLAGIAQWAIGGEETAQWAPLRTYATSIAQRPTAVSLSGPTSMYAGRRAALGVLVTSDGSPVPGASVAFLYQPTGSSGWTTMVRGTTGADGRVSVTSPLMYVSGTWRAYVADTWERLAGNDFATPTTVTKVPTVVSVTAPARVLSGATATAVATVTGLGSRASGAVVQFSWRPSTSATWTVLGRVTTDATGVARKAYVPRTSGYWKATVVASAVYATSTTPGTLATVLVPVVKPASTSVSVLRGASAALRATTSPAGAGQLAYVQRKTSTGWAIVFTAATDSLGRLVWKLPTGTRGTFVYRWYVKATTAHAAAASPSITVKVS